MTKNIPTFEVDAEELEINLREHTVSKIIKLSLPCTLTKEESHNYAKECARLIRDREIVEMEKKDANNDFKSRIDGINNRAASISEKVNANQEFRDVECRNEFNYLALRVTTVRIDTGEVTDVRNMTSAEMQRPLFGGDEE